MEVHVADLLADYISQTETLLAAHQWKQALAVLNACEKLLENLKAQDIECNEKSVLWTLHNIAACHRLLGASKVCANYLDACAYNSKEQLGALCASEHSLTVSVLCERIRLRKYLAKVSIQLCALLSELDRHDLALIKARQAVKEAQFVIKESLAVSYENLTIFKRKKLSSLSLAVKKTIPILEHIERRFQNKRTKKVQKLETRNALGVVSLEDPVFSFQMGDLMEVKAVQFKEFEVCSEAFQLFTRAEVFDLISVCVVSQFCVATELRFLYSESQNAAQIKEAQAWHLKSLQICKELLPSETPMLEHLKVSFRTNYEHLTSYNGTLKAKTSKRTTKKLGETSLSRRSHSPYSTKVVRSTSAKPQSRQATHTSKVEVRKALRSTSRNSGSRKNLERTVDAPLTDRSEFVLDQLLSQFESKSESIIKIAKQLPETRPETATVSAIDSRMSEITQPEPTPPPKVTEKSVLLGVTTIAEESSVSADEIAFTSNDLYGVVSSDEDSEKTTLHPEMSMSHTPVRTPPRSVPSIQLMKKQEARLRRLN